MELNEPVDVIMVCHSEKRRTDLYKIKWRHREYMVKEICMHQIHTMKGIPHHVYTLVAGNLWMKLVCNSQTFFWELQQVSDIEVVS